MICILEPFISADRLEATQVRLGMDHALSFQFGKIWVFWSMPFSVELLEDIGQLIRCPVSHYLFPEPVFIFYVYASCFMLVREDLWKALMAFADCQECPWILGGILILYSQHKRFLVGMPNFRRQLMLLISFIRFLLGGGYRVYW